MTLTLDQIDALLTAGSLAPSGGNTQPWRATVQGKVIELRLDPTRGSVVLDPCADAAVMALGSFEENVALAASAIGVRTTTDFHVDVARGPVVRIELEADRSVTRDELSDVIATRSTNRRPHTGSPIPEALLERLRAACATGCGHELLAVSCRDQKRAVADILAKADRVRVHNPALHHEMFSELRWSATAATDTCDGIDVRSLHLPAPGRLLLRLARSRLVARHFMPAVAIESLSRRLLIQSSHLCTLIMPMPRAPLSWFEGGRTLQRVWLTAARIQCELAVSTAALPWIISAYVLAFGSLLPLGGRAGDLYGRRKVLRIGLVVFTLASLLGGLGPNATLFIAARALQGVGAALVAPNVLALIATPFPAGKPRNQAMAVYAAMSAWA